MAGVEKSLLRVRSLAHGFQTHPLWKNTQFALHLGLGMCRICGDDFLWEFESQGVGLEDGGNAGGRGRNEWCSWMVAMSAWCLHFVSAFWVP